MIPFVFLCQTWSGCGIRMHLVICCWPFTHPTILFFGMETQAPSCGKRAMQRTSFHFRLTPLTPPTWHVGDSASYFICFREFLKHKAHIIFFSFSWDLCLLKNKIPYMSNIMFVLVLRESKWQIFIQYVVIWVE